MGPSSNQLTLLRVVKLSIAFVNFYSMFRLHRVRLLFYSIAHFDHQVDNIQHFLHENKTETMRIIEVMTTLNKILESFLLNQVTRFRRSETRSTRLIVGFSIRVSHLEHQVFFLFSSNVNIVEILPKTWHFD